METKPSSSSPLTSSELRSLLLCRLNTPSPSSQIASASVALPPSPQDPSPLSLLLRILKLSLVTSPLILTTPFYLLLSPLLPLSPLYYRLLTITILLSRSPALVKWGQWASTRNDIFPSSLCQHLSVLHNDGPRHSHAHTVKILSSSLFDRTSDDDRDDRDDRESLREIFGEGSLEATVASGSIAQVYKGDLLWDVGCDYVDASVDASFDASIDSSIDTNEKQVGQVRVGGIAVPRGISTPCTLLNGVLKKDRRTQPNTTMTPKHKVAIKIRHPSVLSLMTLDTMILSRLSKILHMIPPLKPLNLPSLLSEFCITMSSQTSLTTEGRYLDRFGENFSGVEGVGFPKVIWRSEGVLVESWEEGGIVSTWIDGDKNNDDGDYNNNNNNNNKDPTHLPKPSRSFIVTKGTEIYLQMLLVDNLMHADLHPGNIIINDNWDSSEEEGSGIGGSYGRRRRDRQRHRRRKKNKIKHPKLTLVDAGMVATLSPTESSTFIGFLSSIGLGDGRLAGRYILRFKDGAGTSLTEGTPECEEFLSDMVELFRRVCRGYGTDVDLGNVLRSTLSLLRTHRISISSNYATLIVNVMCIDGLARKLVREYNVLDGARGFLEGYRRVVGLGFDDGRRRGKTLRKLLFRAYVPLAAWRKMRRDRRFFNGLWGEGWEVEEGDDRGNGDK